MNNIKKIITVSIISLLLATAIFSQLTFSTNTIIAFIASGIAIIELTIASVVVGKKSSKLHIDFVFPYEALNYLIWNFIFSILVLVVGKIGVYTLPMGWFIAGHVAIIAIFAIKMITLEAGKEHIEQVEKNVKVSTNSMMAYRLKSSAILNFTKDKHTKKLVQSIVDLITYADPVSCDSSMVLENEIESLLTKYESAVKNGKESDIKTLTEELTNTILKRNSIVKLNK